MPRTSSRGREARVSKRFPVAILTVTLAATMLFVHKAQAENVQKPHSPKSAETNSPTVVKKGQGATRLHSDALIARLIEELSQHRPESLSYVRPDLARNKVREFSHKAEKNYEGFLKASVLELTQALEETTAPAEQADYLLVRERFQWLLKLQMQKNSDTRIDMTDPMNLMLNALGPSLREAEQETNQRSDPKQKAS